MYLPAKEKVFTAFGSKRSDRLFSDENNILGNEVKRIFFYHNTEHATADFCLKWEVIRPVQHDQL